MKRRSSNVFWYLLLVGALLSCMLWLNDLKSQATYYTKSNLTEDLVAGNVAAITLEPSKDVPTGTVYVQTSDGTSYNFHVTDVGEVEALIEDVLEDYQLKDVPVYVKAIPEDSWFIDHLLPLLIVAGLVLLFFGMMNAQQNGGANAKMMDFGKSRARKSASETKLKDVAGLKEEKEDLEEIIEFLKNPSKFTEVGARIPKGVLLEGPPGTGKTLLAKAIAGEAGVPFFTVSGSDFMEMFVGVGASRVRDLFEDAKRNAPCIVFIDEIDAVARKRGSGMGGGHDEREQTLNQLLVEMDGFTANTGIIVLAATNRVDILDPAILRPGRFDRKITVNRPDVGGRVEILKVHAKNRPLGEDVDLNQIAHTTVGFTGADLENLLNESSINAAMDGRKYIIQADIQKAFIKVGIGSEKKSRIVSDKEKRITAYHEAGHAILFHVLPDMDPVYTISIIPTGNGAAGYTMPLPEKDEMFLTKGKMRQDIMVSLGGRIAEEIIFGDITTGASSDIQKATARARSMVTRFGMSEKLGLINYDDGQELFIGRDFGQTRSYGDETANAIDDEVRGIVQKCYEEAKAIILKHEAILHKCADLLLEKERITREEFEGLWNEV